MGRPELPILDYLRIENPEFNTIACKLGSNTTSKSDVWYNPRVTQEWGDFDFESLDSIYGGVLKYLLEKRYILDDFSNIPHYPHFRLGYKRSVESLVSRWNLNVVEHALIKAQMPRTV